MVKNFVSSSLRVSTSPLALSAPRTHEDAVEISLDTIVELLISAEYEMAAFRAAVTESYGAAQAELAALDWIHEMEAAEWSISDAIPDWRRFTIAATAKLAERVCPIRSFYSTEELL